MTANSTTTALIKGLGLLETLEKSIFQEPPPPPPPPARHQASSTYEAVLPVAFIIFFMVLLFLVYQINSWGLSGLRKRVKKCCKRTSDQRESGKMAASGRGGGVAVAAENPYLYSSRPVSTSVQTSSSRPTTSMLTSKQLLSSHYSEAREKSANQQQQLQAISGQFVYNDPNNNNHFETDSIILYKLAAGGSKQQNFNQIYHPIKTTNLMLALNNASSSQPHHHKNMNQYEIGNFQGGEVYFSGKKSLAAMNPRLIYKDEEHYDDIEMDTLDNIHQTSSQLELSNEQQYKTNTAATTRNDSNNNTLSPFKMFEQHSSRKSQSRRLSSSRYRPTPVRPRTPRYLPGHDKQRSTAARGRNSLTNSITAGDHATANLEAIRKSLFKSKTSRAKNNSQTLLHRQQDLKKRRSSPIETPQFKANMLLSSEKKESSILYRPKGSNLGQRNEFLNHHHHRHHAKYLPSKSFGGLVHAVSSSNHHRAVVVHKSPTISSDLSHVANMNMVNHSTASPTTTTTTSTTTTTTTSNSGYAARAHMRRIDSADDTTVSSSFSFSIDHHHHHHQHHQHVAKNLRFQPPNTQQLPFSPIRDPRPGPGPEPKKPIQQQQHQQQQQEEKVIQFKIVKSQSAFIESSLSSSLASGSISYNPAKSLFPKPMPLRKRQRNFTNDENLNGENKSSREENTERSGNQQFIYTDNNNELTEDNEEEDDDDFDDDDEEDDGDEADQEFEGPNSRDASNSDTRRQLSRNSHRSSTFKASSKNKLLMARRDQNNQEIEVKKSSTDDQTDSHSHSQSKIVTHGHQPPSAKRLGSVISQQLTKLKPKMSISASTSRLTAMFQTMKNSLSQDEGGHVYLENEIYDTPSTTTQRAAKKTATSNESHHSKIVKRFRSMNSLVLDKLSTAANISIGGGNGKNWTKMTNEKEAATTSCNHEQETCYQCTCCNAGCYHGNQPPKQVSDAAVQTSIVNSNSSSFNSHSTTTMLQTNTYGSIVANLGSATVSHKPSAKPAAKSSKQKQYMVDRILSEASSSLSAMATTVAATTDTAIDMNHCGGMKTSFTIGTCMSSSSSSSSAAATATTTHHCPIPSSNLVKALSNDDACKLTIDFN